MIHKWLKAGVCSEMELAEGQGRTQGLALDARH